MPTARTAISTLPMTSSASIPCSCRLRANSDRATISTNSTVRALSDSTVEDSGGLVRAMDSRRVGAAASEAGGAMPPPAGPADRSNSRKSMALIPGAISDSSTKSTVPRIDHEKLNGLSKGRKPRIGHRSCQIDRDHLMHRYAWQLDDQTARLAAGGCSGASLQEAHCLWHTPGWQFQADAIRTHRQDLAHIALHGHRVGQIDQMRSHGIGLPPIADIDHARSLHRHGLFRSGRPKHRIAQQGQVILIGGFPEAAVQVEGKIHRSALADIAQID